MKHLRDRQTLTMYTRSHKRTVSMEADMGASLSILSEGTHGSLTKAPELQKLKIDYVLIWESHYV